MEIEKIFTDKNSTIKKWSPIVEHFISKENLNGRISKRVIEDISIYADRHATSDSLSFLHGGNVDVSILPLSLKILISCELLHYIQWNIKPFEEDFKTHTYKIEADYTQGRKDKVESVENHLAISIADKISKEALSLMFTLGEIHSAKPNQGIKPEKVNILNKKELYLIFVSNLTTFEEDLKLSEGSPFIICNPLVISLLMQLKDYKIVEPLSKCMSSNRVFKCGEFLGASVLVDPNMLNSDLRILFGSTNDSLVGGLIFEPMYICNNMSVVTPDPLNMYHQKIEMYTSYRFHSGSENSKLAYKVVELSLDPENFL